MRLSIIISNNYDVCEFSDFITMDTLFDKLKKYEMKLKIFDMDGEGEKNNKSLAFKVEDFDSDDDISFMVWNFRKFLKHEKQQQETQNKWHVIPNCPL